MWLENGGIWMDMISFVILEVEHYECCIVWMDMFSFVNSYWNCECCVLISNNIIVSHRSYQYIWDSQNVCYAKINMLVSDYTFYDK